MSLVREVRLCGLYILCYDDDHLGCFLVAYGQRLIINAWN